MRTNTSGTREALISLSQGNDCTTEGTSWRLEAKVLDRNITKDKKSTWEAVALERDVEPLSPTKIVTVDLERGSQIGGSN